MAKAKARGTNAGDPKLEKAIEADPANLDTWSVYADWLQEQSDPRGELAAAQLGLEKSPKDKALLSVEKRLLKEHSETLIGPFARYLCKSGKRDLPGITQKSPLDPAHREYKEDAAPWHIEWRGGFFKSVSVAYPGMDWFSPERGEDDEDSDDGSYYPSHDVAKSLVELLASPGARFLTSLRLGMPNDMEDGEQSYRDILKKLAAVDLSRLRSLYIGDISREESEVSWINIGDISKLYKSLGKLQALTIRGSSDLKLGKIELPELRELTIITGGLKKANLAAICAARWPKLERLELWLGTSSYGGDIALKDLKALLDGKAFPKVTSLAIRNCEFADELAAALGSAKIVKQLKKLDLSKGTMTDAGVDGMIEAKHAFAHLVHLDLSDNYLSKTARTATQIVPAVRTKPQRTPSEYDGQVHRFVALGE